MHSYDWWQQRLAEEFFSPGQGGAAVLFFIDQDEERRLRVGADCVAGLGASVSKILDWSADPYWPVTRNVRRWRQSSQECPPPCLPLLGASVLAAAQMRGGEGKTAGNYYGRLAEVLSPPHPLHGKDYGERLKQHYDGVAALWKDLDIWLRSSGGRFGSSTIRTPRDSGRGSWIGYAQSQALVRASDRELLTQFFRTAGIKAGTIVEPAEVLNRLKWWSRGRQGLSPRLRDALRTGSDDAVLAPLLVALVECWNGSDLRPSAAGKQALPLLVAAAEDEVEGGWELDWYARRVDGIDADELRYPDGTLALASRASGYASYEIKGAAPRLQDVLASGLEARGKHLVARVRAGRHLIPLREHAAAGWIETDRLTACEPYLFLADRAGEARMKALLSQVGLDWPESEETSVPGWRAVADVEFPDDAALQAALDTVGVPSVAHQPIQRLRLSGGLRLDHRLSRRSYLLGGEPDVVLPTLGEHAEPILDDTRLEGLAGTRIPLRGLDLGPGEHKVTAGSSRVSFWLSDWTSSPPPGTVTQLEPDWVPGQVLDTVMVPYAEDSRFIASTGRFIRIHGRSEPSWWKKRATGLGPRARFEVRVPDAAVWLATVRSDDSTEITLVREAPPAIKGLTTEAKKFWSPLLLGKPEEPGHQRLWEQYRKAVFNKGPKVVLGSV